MEHISSKNEKMNENFKDCGHKEIMKRHVRSCLRSHRAVFLNLFAIANLIQSNNLRLSSSFPCINFKTNFKKYQKSSFKNIIMTLQIKHVFLLDNCGQLLCQLVVENHWYTKCSRSSKSFVEHEVLFLHGKLILRLLFKHDSRWKFQYVYNLKNFVQINSSQVEFKRME